MQIISQHGDPTLAEVYVARFRSDDRFLAEFVDARDPDIPMERKWVIIVSTQFGCPIACKMCDAGGDYRGNLTADEMIAQIDCIVERHGGKRLRSAEKFKVQFARMGEPALNHAVLAVLDMLPTRYGAPGLIPCIATTAPAKADAWFQQLIDIRHGVYGANDFQLQISLNSTDPDVRDHLMPWPKMSFDEVHDLIDRFYLHGKRKAALNFALVKDVPVNAEAIVRHFDSTKTCVKITPLNPTSRSQETGMDTALPPHTPEKCEELCNALTAKGFEVILSIGDVRENEIGSNCGMAVRKIAGGSRKP